MRKRALLFFLPLLVITEQSFSQSESLLSDQRLSAVEQLIRKYAVEDETIQQAFLTTPRERFIPSAYKQMAYQNTTIPLGNGLILPTIDFYFRVMRGLQPRNNQNILIAGYGTGYAAALFSLLVEEVYVAEFNEELAEEYSRLLNELGRENVFIKPASSFHSWSDNTPFDLLFLHGALRSVQATTVDLVHDNGRICYSFADDSGFQILSLIERQGMLFSIKQLGESFVPFLDD